MRVTQPPCPYCGSLRAVAFRGEPRTKADVMVRRHTCRDCGHLFVTAQVSLTEDMAERVLEAIA